MKMSLHYVCDIYLLFVGLTDIDRHIIKTLSCQAPITDVERYRLMGSCKSIMQGLISLKYVCKKLAYMLDLAHFAFMTIQTFHMRALDKRGSPTFRIPAIPSSIYCGNSIHIAGIRTPQSSLESIIRLLLVSLIILVTF